MFSVFLTVNPDGGLHFPAVTENSDGTGTSTDIGFDFFVIVQDDAEKENDRVNVEVRRNLDEASVKGWLEARYIGTEKRTGEDLSTETNPISEEFFVRSCVRAQLAYQSGGDQSRAVVSAELLIAMALLLSAKLTELGSRIDGTDAIGPFQLTPEQWQEFLDENEDIELDVFDRGSYYHQVVCAAARMQKLGAEFSANARDLPNTTPEQPVVASFVNVLHCWLLGVPGALAVAKAHGGAFPNRPVRTVLTEADVDADAVAPLAGLVSKIDDAATTVDAFFEATEDKLEAALTSALTRIKEHAPEYIVKPEVNGAPWFEVTLQELAAWDTNNDDIPDFDETSAQGIQKTQRYFKAVWPDKEFAGVTPPWCGAFAGFCLAEADDPSGEVKASLNFQNPALAANWKNWGNIEIPKSQATYPVGAVVVMAPAPNSQSSGHVTFYRNHLKGKKKIECVGGNQGSPGHVQISTYKVSNIVAVRWLAVATEPVNGTGGAIGTDESVRMILAQTIWGEARGESSAGRIAVANVIMNRVAQQKSFYGLTPAAVCKKPWQFSCWNANDPNLAQLTNPANHTTALFRECLEIAETALSGTLPDTVGGATHYHANYIGKPSWLNGNPTAQKTAVIGKHIFYRDVD